MYVCCVVLCYDSRHSAAAADTDDCLWDICFCSLCQSTKPNTYTIKYLRMVWKAMACGCIYAVCPKLHAPYSFCASGFTTDIFRANTYKKWLKLNHTLPLLPLFLLRVVLSLKNGWEFNILILKYIFVSWLACAWYMVECAMAYSSSSRANVFELVSAGSSTVWRWMCVLFVCIANWAGVVVTVAYTHNSRRLCNAYA